MGLQKEAGAIAALKNALSVLNQHLTAHTYLVGHHVTLADIITWSNLVIPFKQVRVSKIGESPPVYLRSCKSLS